MFFFIFGYVFFGIFWVSRVYLGVELKFYLVLTWSVEKSPCFCQKLELLLTSQLRAVYGAASNACWAACYLDSWVSSPSPLRHGRCHQTWQRIRAVSQRSIEMIILSDIYLCIPYKYPNIYPNIPIEMNIKPCLSIPTSDLEAVCRARARVVWWDASKELVQVKHPFPGQETLLSDMAPEWLKIPGELTVCNGKIHHF